MNFNLENVVKMGLAIEVIILLLETNLAVIVELACKKKMVCGFDFEVITLAEGMDHPIEAFLILDHSAWFLTDCKQVDPVFAENQKVICLKQEAFDWAFP